MKPSAPILASALALALLLPGLLAVLPACAMAECEPVMAADAHDCCPPAATSIAASCCRQHLEAPASLPTLPERPELTSLATAATPVAAAPAPAPAIGCTTASESPPLPLDSLAQSCTLRI